MEVFAWIGVLVILLILSFAFAFVIALIEGHSSVGDQEWVIGLALTVVVLCIILASVFTFTIPKMSKLGDSVSTNTIEETK